MVDALAVTVRALSFIAMFEAAGGAWFLTQFASGLPAAGPTIVRHVQTAAVAGLVLVLVHFDLGAAQLSGEFSGLWDLPLLQLAWQTAPGSGLCLRVAGLLLILIGLRGRGRGLRTCICMLGSGMVLLAFITIGHTVDHPQRAALALVLVAHLLAVAFWFGALWPLRRVVTLEAAVTAATVLERFSRIALWVVPGLLLAGTTLAVMLLPGLAVFAQPYGRLLLAKIAGFAVLMGFAALNKLRLTPALARGESAAVMGLRRSLLLEYLIIAAVLTVTAVMTGLFSPD
jgi:putative copper resistance protein D